MKNKTLILAGVLITGLEEAILRITLVQRDKFLRKYMDGAGRANKDDEEKIKIIWTASICQSMIAEHVAIVVRWAAVLLLQPQRYVFDLGYEVDIHPESGYMQTVDSNTIAFAILVEWVSEIAIDRVALGV